MNNPRNLRSLTKKQLGALQFRNLMQSRCATLYTAETWGKDPFCFIFFVVPRKKAGAS